MMKFVIRGQRCAYTGYTDDEICVKRQTS